jgi:hypothetical protein
MGISWYPEIECLSRVKPEYIKRGKAIARWKSAKSKMFNAWKWQKSYQARPVSEMSVWGEMAIISKGR